MQVQVWPPALAISNTHKSNEPPEHTGTSVDPEETYPNDDDLPLPTYKQTVADINHLSRPKRGIKTRKETQEEKYLSDESQIIHAHFVGMSKEHYENRSEYLMYVHEMNKEDNKNKSNQDETINLSDFLTEPSSLIQVLKTCLLYTSPSPRDS